MTRYQMLLNQLQTIHAHADNCAEAAQYTDSKRNAEADSAFALYEYVRDNPPYNGDYPTDISAVYLLGRLGNGGRNKNPHFIRLNYIPTWGVYIDRHGQLMCKEHDGHNPITIEEFKRYSRISQFTTAQEVAVYNTGQAIAGMA